MRVSSSKRSPYKTPQVVLQHGEYGPPITPCLLTRHCILAVVCKPDVLIIGSEKA